MLAQAGHLVPRFRAVGAAEQRCVFDARVNKIGIRQRRLEMPDPLELPRVRRSVVPLVRAGIAIVGELVASGFPRPAAVVGPLNDLAEPRARLRRVDAVGVGRRSLHVIDLPATKMRAAHIPAIPLAVGGEDEATLPGAYKNANATHAPP